MSPAITDRPVYTFRQGTAPLLVSMPHVGTYVPPAIADRLTDEARHVPDTDWHLERLYDFVVGMGASVLVATHSRYVADLNRPPDGSSLYPGQSVTGLCPVDTFDDTPLYRDAGDVPGAEEVAARRAQVWQPYHDKLAQELARLRAQHGVALLWDAHSIRSVLPRFFEGKLTDLNLGTGKGIACAQDIAEAVYAVAREGEPQGYTSVLNGRFTGGYITRHYGQPEQGIHAIQLEMTQCSYMQEALPFDYLPERADRIQPLLQRMVQTAFDGVMRSRKG
ncbi:N-formylglutamate deformylase [Bordetella bronchialis]|uniref:N-formylglutamate deformylase n=1 Tax=Bordetella bronchialis TaxID=463025 RepID=A0A193FWR6_9BORD|nr:N-formylglutamate deformylase [Bordetella bronchialis]ANN66721.1 N-formylglutamate deformylase [Bordetella bronchialis]ANN71798.1 N-formylglutamate deformylase [Bordetella bronchialis]